MSGRVFLDTNILVYAYDKDSDEKHTVALELIKELWESRAGVLSNQVLQEFYVAVTRKITKPLPKAEAREILRAYACWNVRELSAASIVRASEIEERYRLSFWDAMVIVAAYESKCDKLLTEDMKHGQMIEGVIIENPFRAGR